MNRPFSEVLFGFEVNFKTKETVLTLDQVLDMAEDYYHSSHLYDDYQFKF